MLLLDTPVVFYKKKHPKTVLRVALGNIKKLLYESGKVSGLKSIRKCFLCVFLVFY
jgi:hypothetical protein